MEIDELVLDLEGYDDQVSVARFMPPDGLSEWPSVDHWQHSHWAHWLGQHDWTPSQVNQYLQNDRYEYGLGFRRHAKEAIRWFYNPGPKAVELHKSHVPNLLYGGARGGMKSHSARHEAYRHCFSIPYFRAIIARRTFEELKRNHLDKAKMEAERLNEYFQDVVMEVIMGDHEIRFPKTGSKIVCIHCQNPGDEEKYLGDEYDMFVPDEMATFEKSQIVAIGGSLRTTKPGILARLIGTSNPGGAHTLWIKRWFIDRVVPRTENPKYRPERYQFIPSKLYDNPFLMDPDGTYSTYEERLYAYSPQRRRQLLLGDWDAISGQFFPEWSASHIAVLDIPAGCKIERWVDWGYDPNPGVCHWVACFPNGRLYVFAEWVFNGEGRPKQVASEVAKKIKQITDDQVLKQVRGQLGKSIGDPSMWARDGHSGESYEETFRRNGVRMVQADNDRVLGWGRYRAWLRPHPESGRWLMYHPDCKYAIRTVPTLIHDKNNPDDLDTSGEDHAADADRYGVMGRPSPTYFATASTPTIPGSIREILDQINQQPVRQFGKVM